ncbi:MAG: deoxyribonuclease IV [Thermoanaerobaculia bacterium]|nr:deoxyribonuclease IV [Thermoanaerobaculia bacterium]
MNRFRFAGKTDLLGAHVSASGGAPSIFERGRAIGANALAFFSKNNNRWKAKDLDEEVIARFEEARREQIGLPLVIHASYLINLAATSEPVLERSIAGMVDELRRAAALGVSCVVLHPGAHMGAGVEEGIDRLARSMDRVHELTAELDVVTLFETSAGQGSCLGHTFAELGMMIDRIDRKDRLGICVDTCHLFAAGYDIRTRKGWEATVEELDREVGIDQVALFHLNDSRRELGSRVDRHQHIGEGEIGLEPFGWILNDEHFRGIPKVLETPKTVPDESDLENLARLRSLLV